MSVLDDSIDDGEFLAVLDTPIYANLPANYHEGACGVSFADGHGELHKWIGGTLNIPNFGTRLTFQNTTTNDPDWVWMKIHSTVLRSTRGSRTSAAR